MAVPGAVRETPDSPFAGDPAALDLEDVDSTRANDEEVDLAYSFPDMFRQIQTMKSK